MQKPDTVKACADSMETALPAPLHRCLAGLRELDVARGHTWRLRRESCRKQDKASAPISPGNRAQTHQDRWSKRKTRIKRGRQQSKQDTNPAKSGCSLHVHKTRFWCLGSNTRWHNQESIRQACREHGGALGLVGLNAGETGEYAAGETRWRSERSGRHLG